MKCEAMRTQLSAYFDDELSPDERAAVAAHLAACDGCRDRLADYQRLSQSVRDPVAPATPVDLWETIAEQLPARPRTSNWTIDWNVFGRRSVVGKALAALAAAVVLVAVAWWNLAPAHRDPHDMSLVMGQYLDLFKQDPIQAQQVLLASYPARRVSSEEAAAILARPVLAPVMLDGGMLRAECYVFTMPCCKCVQSIYRSPDGRSLALFEKGADEPSWFHDRPAIDVRCAGRPARIVELKQGLAASWKEGNRHLTLVGTQSLDETVACVSRISRPAATD